MARAADLGRCFHQDHVGHGGLEQLEPVALLDRAVDPVELLHAQLVELLVLLQLVGGGLDAPVLHVHEPARRLGVQLGEARYLRDAGAVAHAVAARAAGHAVTVRPHGLVLAHVVVLFLGKALDDARDLVGRERRRHEFLVGLLQRPAPLAPK